MLDLPSWKILSKTLPSPGFYFPGLGLKALADVKLVPGPLCLVTFFMGFINTMIVTELAQAESQPHKVKT